MEPPSPRRDTEEPLSTDSSSSWAAKLTRLGQRFFVIAVSLLSTYLGVCFFALAVYSATFPPVTGVQLQRSVERLLAGTPGERTYVPVPLSQLEPNLALAVVAGEDSRFFMHRGFDWEEIEDAIEDYREGGALRGGSTITQQLVKNLFMTTHSTVLRKALEVPLTYGAELLLSKRRILELYVNVIEWGPGVYGAEAAARHHYGTSADHLTRYQAAALASCIPSPLTRRPQTAGWYRNVILRRMNKIGHLPVSTPSASADPTPSRPSTPTSSSDSVSSPSTDTISPTPDSGDTARTAPPPSPDASPDSLAFP